MLCLVMSSTNDQMLLSIFILGSKFGVSQVFNLAYLGNMQLFPTSMLATSYGICNIFDLGQQAQPGGQCRHWRASARKRGRL